MSATMPKLSLLSTTARPSSGFVAHGFPSSFQLDPADVLSGAVRVFAKAPSGMIFPLDVVESEGVYATNFTPTEIGDWQVSILFEGENIQGSPFNVRVYDPGLVKVSGLTTGFAGRQYNFSVDTSEAGDGLLAVDITHNDRNVPTQIALDSYGLHKVSFTPSVVGIYSIQIYFAGLELTGSPFEAKIVDSADITVSGDGIGHTPVNQSTFFLISTTKANTMTSDLDITISSPQGAKILPRISHLGNGIHRVEYTPREVGHHLISVLSHSQPVPGSPFQAEAFDASKIKVSGLQSSYSLGDSVTFDIDVSNAGDGNLEIMVNEGRVPCSVSNFGYRKYRATFSPVETKQHSIALTFNGLKIIGSPWYVDIKNNSKLSVTENGAELIPLGQVANMEIVQAKGLTGRLTANIKGPSGRSVASNIFHQRKGVHRLEYTPVEIGLHTIDVMLDGTPIPGSPFSSRVFSADAISLSQVPSGAVGSPVEFTVDVSRAGEGKLEIMVNRGTVPNSVRSVERGVYEVSFVPRTSQPHIVDITFNGRTVPGGPITVPIIDQSKVSVSGNGIIQAAVNQNSVFHVNTRSSGDADLSVKVTSLKPGGQVVPTVIRGSSSKGYDVEFVTKQTGDYRVDVEYGGNVVKGSPFIVKSFDISKIQVSGIGDGIVGQTSSFTANVENAGEGDMELSITSSNGNNIPNEVDNLGSKRFNVSYTPVESGKHRASITFNGQHVPGSPFVFNVIDLSKVNAQGGGLGTVSCNKMTSFTVNGPGLQPKDLEIVIKGPIGQSVNSRTSIAASNSLTVEYLPTVAGDYDVGIKYRGQQIAGSPFTVHAWDHSKVFVSNVQAGRVLQESKFDIDASKAGIGNLETIVSCDSEIVPNFVTAEGSSRFAVSFTPLKAETHTINIKFNGEPVPGSPFHHAVLDGRKAVASGEGLGHILAKRRTSFDVMTRDVGGDATILVEVFDSKGELVSSQVNASSSGYRIFYTPETVGTYTVNVMYADVPIKGSPFHPKVYDPGYVKVMELSDGMVGKTLSFTVDANAAGEGHVNVKVSGQTSHPYVDISPKTDKSYTAAFEPLEAGKHRIYVQFNDIQIPGSPFEVVVLDAYSMSLKHDASRHYPTNKPVQIELESKGALNGKVTAKVTDPYGKSVNCRVRLLNGRNIVEFVPVEVGPHTLDVFCGSEPVKGSPVTVDIYDSFRVKVFDLPNSATVGEEVTLLVDTSEAGSGDIDVSVTSDRTNVQLLQDQGSEFMQSFTFVPRKPNDHLISVSFNGEKISGSPFLLKVKNPIQLLRVVNPSLEGVAVNSSASVLIETRGSAINPSDLDVRITGPYNESLPFKLLEKPDGGCKIEYTCKNPGHHMLEILYDNKPILGTPLYIEAFDPNKIQIDSKGTWFVGEKVLIDVNQQNAGKADIGAYINGPRGTSVPFDISNSSLGHRITFVPTEQGKYQTHLTYGGISIPGCPVIHNVNDSVLAIVSGSGLQRGIRNKVATFTVDSKGQRGELVVQVDGPNSIARCNIEPGPNGTYNVNYIPVEVGVYNVAVRWNGNPVAGSPFHPTIIDPSKLDVVGGWQSFLRRDGCWFLTIHEPNTVVFESKNAGPGHLSAEVTYDGAILPTDIKQLDADHVQLTFVPRSVGEHVIKVFWNDVPLPRSPIIGMAALPVEGQRVLSTSVSPSTPNADKVILTGQGLHQAKVHQRADFVIDGTEAGRGFPEVHLVGLNCDINVQCVPLGGQKYRCSYVATMPGAYLLNIMWANHPIRGSPFKVTATGGSSASKVTYVVDTLRSGSVGQELKSVIDTRFAGSGELIAQCIGPSKMAICELVDHRDGTFTLYIKPLEAGKHILEIKYGDEHIPGSPFVIKVSGSPDASKVTARGPGLQHGLLSAFQSHFVVDTTGAGAGQLTVRVRGPKDAFHVEMQRDKHKDRRIMCFYDPTEVGDYVVHIKWSGVHVPGSPFHVHIADSEAELEKIMAEDAFDQFDNHTTPSPNQHNLFTYSE